MHRRVDLLPCGLVLLWGLSATGQPTPDDFFDASVRHLRRTVTAQRDGSHLPRLFALRQLHDPTLEPLFYQLAHHEEWQVQVHAVLGLAEIDPQQRIDPWLVTQTDSRAHEHLIANAVDMELIGTGEIRQLLDWEELQAVPRLLLTGELLLAGEPIERETLTRLAASANDRVSCLASILLTRLGDESALSVCAERLDALPARDRRRHLLWILEAIRQYEVIAAVPWTAELLQRPGLDEDVVDRALFAMLALDPERGLPRWRARLGRNPSYRDQVRYGMLLLAAGTQIPPAAYARLSSEEELARRIAATGIALSSGEDPSEALIALLDLGHLKTAAWAMETLRELPDEQAIPVYEHLIDSAQGARIGRSERNARAVEATARLFEIAPGRVTRRLMQAPDDSPEQEVLLLGLFDSRSSAAGSAAAQVRRIGAGRADSLALLLIARHTESLPEDELRQLGMIAAGGGRVSEGLQVQAAWLYLKLTNRIDQALGRVFDDAS
ncbi:MAG: hypothetical protein SYC29_18555 [Planctomycetota bacterium]|nr:hypothetical protein [Planctomycetota bacterium]